MNHVLSMGVSAVRKAEETEEACRLAHDIDSVSSHEAKAHSGREEHSSFIRLTFIVSTRYSSQERTSSTGSFDSIGWVADTARYMSFSEDQYPSQYLLLLPIY